MDAPAEVLAPPTDDAYYQLRAETNLREPYRIPYELLKDIKKEALLQPECPLIAFINGRSGGRAGADLANTLYRALGRAQVFDLSEYRPAHVLKKLYENFEHHADLSGGVQPRLRILACGGDGTITWILKTIKDLGLQPEPAVAMMPLGTGNDLARSFNWGPAFDKAWVDTHAGIYNTLLRISQAKPEPLDIWNLTINLPRKELLGNKPHCIGSIGETPSDANAPCKLGGSFWNYFSIGLDAKAAHGFHHLRETKPSLASSRAMNKFWYGWFSCSSGWFCCTKPLSAKVAVQYKPIGSTEWKSLDLPTNVKALVVMNLQSYAGGTNLWGESMSASEAKKNGWYEPTLSDGLLEVVGFCSGYSTAAVMSKATHALRLCQSRALRFELKAQYTRPDGNPSHAYMQVDGEPWMQDVPSSKGGEPVVVEIEHGGQSNVLHNILKIEAKELIKHPSNNLDKKRIESMRKSKSGNKYTAQDTVKADVIEMQSRQKTA